MLQGNILFLYHSDVVCQTRIALMRGTVFAQTEYLFTLIIQTDHQLKIALVIWRIFYNGFLFYFADVICLDSDLEL